MSYIGFSDVLTSRYCSRDKECIWVEFAGVNPLGENTLYFFDCVFHEYSREEYTQRPELRILLSFKSPLFLNELYYTEPHGFRVLESRSPCSKSVIEKCIGNALARLKEESEKAWEIVEKTRKTPRWLRFFIPVRDERSEAKGRYYGVLAKRDLLEEMVSLLGYRNGVLESTVKPVYVLVSIDFRKHEVYALVGDKPIRLGAHMKILDFERLLQYLNSIR